MLGVQDDNLEMDFIDLNMGCPIDLVRSCNHSVCMHAALLHHAAAARPLSQHDNECQCNSTAMCVMKALKQVICLQICNKGMGSALLQRPKRIAKVVQAAALTARNCCVTFKTRTGFHDKHRTAAELLRDAGAWGAAAVTVHGRTRAQRYSKLADWTYIEHCAAMAAPGKVQARSLFRHCPIQISFVAAFWCLGAV
jgi:hypothetical protein